MHVTKETARKGGERRPSSNREVSTPCNLQGSTKTQPDSKPQGTGRDFPRLEMDWRSTHSDICKKKNSSSETKKQISSGQTAFVHHRGQVSWFPSARSHCDGNNSVTANLGTEAGTEIWGARWNLQDPLPALSCVRNHRPNTYLSDPHLQSWCCSSLWNPARQNRALPGTSRQWHEQTV